MFKAPSGTKINILQDIQLRKSQNDCFQVRKKPRVTSSSLMLDEEPVISDSDEERELTKFLFGAIPSVENTYPKAKIQCDKLTCQKTTIPVTDKYRNAEVQCDLLTPNETLLGLIKQCVKLNPDDFGEFKEIIESCEQYMARLNNADGLSDIGYVSKNDLPCSSSSRKKKKKETEMAKPNKRLKRSVASTRESRSKSDSRNKLKRMQITAGDGPFSSTQIFDKTFKKPFDVDIGNASEIKNCSPGNLTNVKALARNWMKPNKSLCSVEDDLKIKPHFASLQPTKVRRLYSPSQWLISQEYLNSCCTNN